MGKFKNLEEIIELCSEELDENSEYYDENVHATFDFEDLKDLENLINKNKELEKMVELMAKEYVCKGNKNKYCRIWETKEYGSCVECVIESFRKKAKKKVRDEE